MKTKNGFTLMKGSSEIRSYLNSQKVSRSVTRIQIHHMYSPSYSTWEKTDKKVFDEPHFGRTESLNSYGKSTWGNRDDKGKYIAQQFNVFPDGYITSGRSLNNTPIGIKGWNTNAICIEIYGNFDKGKDTMNSSQKESVIQLVGELCKRFKITPSENTIRYHAWFSAGGTYLGDYSSSRSGKTCPGTAFFGGNTKSAYNKNFLPAIKNYVNNGSTNVSEPKPVTVNYTIKVTASELNIRKEPNASSAKVGHLNNGATRKIVKELDGWGLIENNIGWISLNYTKKVSSGSGSTSGYPKLYKITASTLNVRKGPSTSYSIETQVHKNEVYTIMEVKDGWGRLKSGAGWISMRYTKAV